MADYFVNSAASGASDSNTGLVRANPLVTIAAAITKAPAGSRIYVDGNAVNYGLFTMSKADQQVLPIDGVQPILRGTTGSLNCVRMTSSGCTLGGANGGFFIKYGFTPSNKKSAWVDITGVASYNTVLKCDITKGLLDYVEGDGTVYAAYDADFNNGWRDDGIKIDTTGAWNTVDDCLIYAINKGVHIQGPSPYATVKDTHIKWCVQSCIAFNGDDPPASRYVRITYNLLEISHMEDIIQTTQHFFTDEPDPDARKALEVVDISNLYTQIDNNIMRVGKENILDLKGAGTTCFEKNLLVGSWGNNDGAHATRGTLRGSMRAVTSGKDTSTSHLIARDNIIFDNAGGGKIWPKTCWYNNFFVWNRRDGSGPGQTNPAGNDLLFTGLHQWTKTHADQPADTITYAMSKMNFFANMAAAHALKLRAGDSIDLNYNQYLNGQVNANYPGSSPQTTYNLTNWRTELATAGYPASGRDANSGASIATMAAAKIGNVGENPAAADWATLDWTLDPTSPLKGAGGPIDTAANSGTNSTSLQMTNGHWCRSNWGRADMEGDTILINGQVRTIATTNYTTRTHTLSAAATWATGAQIYRGSSTVQDVGAPPFRTVVDPGPPDPDPTTSGNDSFDVTRVACATSTGNQNITMPAGLTKAPVMLEFTVSYATADGTAADEAVLSQGFATATQQWVIGLRNEHGQTDTDNSRNAASTACILLLAPTTGATIGLATIVSLGLTTSVINWTTAPASGYLMTVTAYEGSAAWCGKAALPQTLNGTVTVTPGITANIGFALMHSKLDAANAANWRWSRGMWTYSGGTLTQQCYTAYAPDAQTTGVENSYLLADRTLASITTSGSLVHSVEVGTITTTTFVATDRVATPSEDADMYFAVVQTDNQLWSGVIDVPTTAAATDYTAPNFPPVFVKLLTTLMTAVATTDSSATAGGVALSSFSATAAYSTAVNSEDGAATTNTQSLSDNVPIRLPAHDGSEGAGVGILATTATMLTNGFSLNYTNVPGTSVRKALAMVIRSPRSITVEAVSDVTTGDAPLDIELTVTHTTVATTATSLTVVWGDGTADDTVSTPGASEAITHTYTVAGTYSITATITDGTVEGTRYRENYIVVTEPPVLPDPPDVTDTPVLASVSVPRLLRGDVLASVNVNRVTMDNLLRWKAYGSATIDTDYEIWSDVTTANTFALLTTITTPTTNGAAGYTPISTTLAVGTLARATSFILADGTDFANGDAVKIDRETIVLGGKSTNTFAVSLPGQDNTIQVGHAEDVPVYKMHESYTHSSVSWGSRHVIRYRVIAMPTGPSGIRLIAAEAVAVNPGKAPTNGSDGIPSTNDKALVYGIEDKEDGTPVEGIVVSINAPGGVFNTSTGETFNSTGLSTVTDASGYWELQVPRGIVLSDPYALQLVINELSKNIVQIPDKDYVHYSECISA